MLRGALSATGRGCHNGRQHPAYEHRQFDARHAIGVGTDLPESRRFLRHVTAATAFGGGLDGFDLGVISVVILHINHDLELTPAMEGLVSAASLLGIFIGAPLFGFLTDKFGRRRMFLVDIIAFIVIGVGQAFAMGGVS